VDLETGRDGMMKKKEISAPDVNRAVIAQPV
jgi:hypothetical protein